jgi:hypothetical protein
MKGGNMTFLNGIRFIDMIGAAMLLLTIFIYAASCYWNIRYLILSKKDEYTLLRQYTAVLDFLLVCAFTYMLINTFAAAAYNIEFFDVAIIRPLIFLLGGSVAANAKARYDVVRDRREKI